MVQTESTFSRIALFTSLLCLAAGATFGQTRKILELHGPKLADDGGALPDQSVTYAPFLAHGLEGTTRWRAVISIMNQQTQAVDMLMEFCDAQGNPLLLPFTGGHFSGIHGPIPAGSNVSAALVDVAETVKVGYVRITTRPGMALAVDVSTVRIAGFNLGGFLHGASDPVSDPREIGVASSTGQSTVLSLINPGTDPVDVTLSARTWDGNPACAVTLHLQGNAQVWSNVSSVTTCIRPNTTTYTLNIAPSGPIVLGGYYIDSGLYAAIPLHTTFVPATGTPSQSSTFDPIL